MNKPFPVDVVLGVVSDNLRVVYHKDQNEYQVNCDNLSGCDNLFCEDCPINNYTSTHNDCVQAVTYIRDNQLPSLLLTNPELFV